MPAQLLFEGASNPLSAFFQTAQAAELISTLDALPNPLGAPIIVVGDINSSPEDPIIGPIVPPYTQLVAAGYTDTWTLRPGRPPGFTCCQLGDLSNPESILGERIDVVFSDAVPVRVKANVVGTARRTRRRPPSCGRRITRGSSPVWSSLRRARTRRGPPAGQVRMPAPPSARRR